MQEPQFSHLSFYGEFRIKFTSKVVGQEIIKAEGRERSKARGKGGEERGESVRRMDGKKV